MSDDELLMHCDSLLSLIRYREEYGLTDQTRREIDTLLGSLRPRTDAIHRARAADQEGPNQ